jgi:hypothetical protein
MKGFISAVIRSGENYLVGRWYTAKEMSSVFSSSCGPQYEKGFHVWHTCRAAKSWRDFNEVVVKVAVADPIVTGLQNGRRVTVARRRKIIEVVTE